MEMAEECLANIFLGEVIEIHGQSDRLPGVTIGLVSQLMRHQADSSIELTKKTYRHWQISETAK